LVAGQRGGRKYKGEGKEQDFFFGPRHTTNFSGREGGPEEKRGKINLSKKRKERKKEGGWPIILKRKGTAEGKKRPCSEEKGARGGRKEGGENDRLGGNRGRK